MKKFVSVFLCLIMVLSLGSVASAENSCDIDYVVSDTANYIYKTVSEPQVGSIGGEWAVLGLARGGVEIPEEYYQD